jgi:hypothetical protein
LKGTFDLADEAHDRALVEGTRKVTTEAADGNRTTVEWSGKFDANPSSNPSSSGAGEESDANDGSNLKSSILTMWVLKFPYFRCSYK